MAVVILRKKQKTLSHFQLSKTHKIFKKVTHNKHMHPQAPFKSMSPTIKGERQGEGKIEGKAGRREGCWRKGIMRKGRKGLEEWRVKDEY